MPTGVEDRFWQFSALALSRISPTKVPMFLVVYPGGVPCTCLLDLTIRIWPLPRRVHEYAGVMVPTISSMASAVQVPISDLCLLVGQED